MIRTELETERLKLRLFTLNDLQVMFELNNNPDVIRYAEKTPAKDLAEAASRLQQGPLADYEKYGYGRFAVELKETGKVIGFCGIKYLTEIDLNEVGYRYLPEFWGKGIATEAAKVCIDFARTDLKLSRIVALIIPENTGSIRVAEKLGMTSGPIILYDDTEFIQYELGF